MRRMLSTALLACTCLLALSAASASAAPPPLCAGDHGSTGHLCYLLQPVTGGTYVFTLYTPSDSPAMDEIKSFVVETTVPQKALRPHNLCTSAGTGTGTAIDGTLSNPFVGTYYITKCKTAIKPGNTFQMCFNDGNVTPPATSAGTWLFFNAPPWGSSYSGVSAALSRCPAPATESLSGSGSGSGKRPVNTRRPTVKRSGKELTCNRGSWHSAKSYAYAWTVNGKVKHGARGAKLAVNNSLKKHSVVCRVTASDKAGRTTASSRAFHVP